MWKVHGYHQVELREEYKELHSQFFSLLAGKQCLIYNCDRSKMLKQVERVILPNDRQQVLVSQVLGDDRYKQSTYTAQWSWVSSKGHSKFEALHRYWWRLHMSKKFSSGTKNPKQNNKPKYWNENLFHFHSVLVPHCRADVDFGVWTFFFLFWFRLFF